MRILIIDMDARLRESLKAFLGTESFVVESCADGSEGLELALTHGYDVILADKSARSLGGVELCRALRREGDHTPFVLLSDTAAKDDRDKLISAGVDDLLAKPMNLPELRFKIHSLLRRPRFIAPALLRVGDLVLDPLEQRARRGQREIYLTRKEFALAEYLVRRRGVVVGRAELLQHVWSSKTSPLTNTIEAHILNLRRKIDHGQKRKLIHTIPGRGYKLGEPERTIFTH